MTYIAETKHPKTDALVATIERLAAAITSEAQSARGLPERYAAEVYYLKIEAKYDSGKQAKAVAEAIRQAATESERQRGEQERDAALAELGRRIESLRVLLPGLAAAACIEIGAIGREIAEEARR